MVPQIDKLTGDGIYLLCHMRSILRPIKTATIIVLVNNYLVIGTDYYDSLLVGFQAYQVDRVQSVMKYATRLIHGLGMYEHVT